MTVPNPAPDVVRQARACELQSKPHVEFRAVIAEARVGLARITDQVARHPALDASAAQDRLGPIRGIAFGLLIVTLFWTGIAVLAALAHRLGG